VLGTPAGGLGCGSALFTTVLCVLAVLVRIWIGLITRQWCSVRQPIDAGQVWLVTLLLGVAVQLAQNSKSARTSGRGLTTIADA
jgi:hypothetical protein